MDITPFLAELRSRDIRIWIEGDRLRCDAPPGVLTAELRERLRERKDDLVAFLRGAEALSEVSRSQRALVPLVPVQVRSRRLPLFAVGGHNGDVFCYRVLARSLGEAQPFYGLQPPGADGQGDPLEQVEQMASYFAEQIRALHPQGPYLLLGFCAGGAVAFELAQQLRRAGGRVALLALIASPHPHEFRRLPTARRYLREQWRRVGMHAGMLLWPWPDQRRYLAAAFRRRRNRQEAADHASEDPLLIQRRRVERATLAALARYGLKPYPGTLHLFLPGSEWMGRGGLAARWRGAAARVVEHFGPPGSTGDDMLREVHGPVVAEMLRPLLREAESG